MNIGSLRKITGFATRRRDHRPGPPPPVQEDDWIPTVCSVCYNQCGVLVHRQDGVVVKIEGNPENPAGAGRICAKGLSAVMTLYDRNRLTAPVKRTNPEKGIGIDPGWVEISWDEALDTMTEKLQKIRQENPAKLMTCGGVGNQAGGLLGGYFSAAFGPTSSFLSNGHQCGNAEHTMSWSLNSAPSTQPDFRYCNYLIVFGSGVGAQAYYAFTSQAQAMADARARGMKLVCFDPICSAVAGKADDWIPIRPGTDGAVALAMHHVLLNELGIYDREHLQHHTNAPYLIKADGHYLRDPDSGKPLVWDAEANSAKTYDDPSVQEFALEGRYTIMGTDDSPDPQLTKGVAAPPVAGGAIHPIEVTPSFQLLKERVATIPPEKAEEISSVPAATIRRIAKEYAAAARIGSSIVIDGKKLPYRPVAVNYFKGAHGHNRTWLSSMAMSLLSEVMGADNVPGGVIGSGGRCDGYPASGLPQWGPVEGPDGLMHVQSSQGSTSMALLSFNNHPTEPQEPTTLGLTELFTTAFTSFAGVLSGQHPKKFGIEFEPEMVLNTGANHLMSMGDPRVTEELLKKLYVIEYKLWLDESSELADLVLPDAHYLERTSLFTQWLNHSFPPGLGDWAASVRQTIVEPQSQCRDMVDTFLEVADRLDMRGDYNRVVNLANALKPEYALDQDKKYAPDEMRDRILMNVLGPEHGLEWFKENGVLRWPKKVEEVYWAPFTNVRVPIYFEWILGVGDKVKSILQKLDIREINTEDYDPLPNWKPCKALEAKNEEYPLQAFYYRVAALGFGWTMQNTWLSEIAERDPVSLKATLNVKTADRLGLHEGDPIWIESANTGGRVLGRAHLSDAVHPEVIGIANNGGHWSDHRPVAKGKGTFFERLIPLSWEYTDPVTLSIDCDAAVKVYRVRKGEATGIGWT